MSYYPLSTQQVWQEVANRSALPVALLGDLDSLACRYNALWLENEREAASTEGLRLHITRMLLDELKIGNLTMARTLAQAFGEIRDETGIAAYSGVHDLLTDLKAKYKLALYTNGRSDMQWRKIHSLGLDQMMDTILVAGDIGIYKPDPRGFDLLLEQLAVPPEAGLFVGDNYDTDIVGAHNAGMCTAWVMDDKDTVSDRVQPTYVLSETSRLREVLL